MFKDSDGVSFSRPAPMQHVPENARHIHTGPLFSLYQWDQELFDGSSAVFERLRERDGVNCIAITEDEEFLLLEEEQPGRSLYLGLPGGGIEDGEDPVAAIKRELLEETGYRAGSVVYLQGLQLNPVADRAIYTFLIRGAKKEHEGLSDAGERITVQKLSFDDFMQRITSDDRFLNKEVGFYLFRQYMQLGSLEAVHDFLLGK